MENLINDNFYKNYCELRKKINSENFKNFCNLNGDSARFQFIHNLKFINDDLESNMKCDDFDKKDLIKSDELKKLGNNAFSKSKWADALKFYNQCYLMIPSTCEKELAIIFANRSAALYHMEKFDAALEDIDRAIKMNYPKEMLYKVKERRARCLLGQKEHEKAINAFKDALHAIDDAKVPQEKRAKLERDSQVMIKILQRNQELEKEKNMRKEKCNVKDDEENEEETEDHEQPFFNKDTLNSAVKIEYSAAEGRFAKAENNIKVGEIIVLERPHASVLLEKYTKTHCLNCFKIPMVHLVCENCPNAIYCSEICKTSAEKYHSIECSILPKLWKSGASITCHLALRMISQKTEEYFLNIKSELDSLKTEETDLLKNDDYRKIYNLVRHETQRNAEDFIQRTIMSYFLTNLLRDGNFFKKNDDSTFALIGGLVLRNLQILQFNAHEVAELQQKTKQDIGDSVFIGGAIYPTLSLFNHSCDPGIVRYYKGNCVVARAIKNIRKDEMIAENYGPIFTQVVREERKSTLKSQYWFDCECKACLDNWPLFQEMENTKLRFRCEGGQKTNCKNILLVPVEANDFMFKCTECGEHTNILKGLKAIEDTDLIFRTATRLLDSGDRGKALFKFIEMLNILDEYLAAPFKDFHLCQQGIRRCMLEFGNRNFG